MSEKVAKELDRSYARVWTLFNQVATDMAEGRHRSDPPITDAEHDHNATVMTLAIVVDAASRRIANGLTRIWQDMPGDGACLVADVPAIIGSIDIVMGEFDR